MKNIFSTFDSTVPLSVFNHGMARQVFDEVQKDGPKVVMNQNVSVCVLLSPKDYMKLMDEIEDIRLLKTAVQRLNSFDPAQLVSEDEMCQHLGIAERDLNGFEEIEFE